jgi:hypothetical protein
MRKWLNQFFCRHEEWRPAIYRGREGVKICADCRKRKPMSDAEFYAEFGTTINHLLASRENA